MQTPIYDFVQDYIKSKPIRLHMPGHKGVARLGCEEADITEIDGADVLYEASGIINESENNATRLFDTAHTFYSAEGSSLCIKAMLATAVFDLRKHSTLPSGNNQRPLILAAANIHKSVVYACAFLDIDIERIFSKNSKHLCECKLTPNELREKIENTKRDISAVYITSPDYLGNIADISALSRVCREYGIPLLVDNAHGAYLAFLSPSEHPIALGADMCCDSAHKTLPVLTGGAYLHISKNSAFFKDIDQTSLLSTVRSRLSLFASTSPSYLILQSLDLCNRYLEEVMPSKLNKAIDVANHAKTELQSIGYVFNGDEPLKLTLDLKESNISAPVLCEALKASNIHYEYCDRDRAVFMLSSESNESELIRLCSCLVELKSSAKASRSQNELYEFPQFEFPQRIMSVREAVFAPHVKLPIRDCINKICACPSVSCPPAVPIVISGELITEQAVKIFEYYGISSAEIVEPVVLVPNDGTNFRFAETAQTHILRN